jgi:hypothetical protein
MHHLEEMLTKILTTSFYNIKWFQSLESQFVYENNIVNIKYNSTLDIVKLDAYVRACNEVLLGCDGYRRLAAVEARLIREYQVAQR